MKNIPTIDLFNAIKDKIAKGELTKDDVDRYLLEHPSKHMTNIIDIIHTMFCRQEHPEDLDTKGDLCTYNIENLLDNPWKGKAHQVWWKTLSDVVQSSGMSDKDFNMMIMEGFVPIASKLEKEGLILKSLVLGHIMEYDIATTTANVTYNLYTPRKEEDGHNKTDKVPINWGNPYRFNNDSVGDSSADKLGTTGDEDAQRAGTTG